MKKFLLIICTILLNGCTPTITYFCYLNSMGSSPQEKTYYITSGDILLDKSLEYKEYFRHLNLRLNELGYVQADSTDASIKILFNYKIGEQKVHKKSVSSLEPVTISTSPTSTTTLSGTQLTFSSTSGSTTTTLVPKTSNMETIKYPVSVEISAVDAATNDAIWEITIVDEVERETQIPTMIPYLILCAKDYFGINTQGEKRATITIKKEEAEDKYGLIWPY